MQPRCGFIQQIERASCHWPAQLSSQFDPLGFTTGESRRGLSQRHIIKTDIAESFQGPQNARIIGKQLCRLTTLHFEHISNRLAMQLDFQHLLVVSPRLAFFARNPDVGQKVHFDFELPTSLAGLATATGHVKAERPSGVTPFGSQRNRRIQLANEIEYTGIGRWVAAGCIAKRRLVNANDLVDISQAFDFLMPPRLGSAAVQASRQCGVQNLLNQ